MKFVVFLVFVCVYSLNLLKVEWNRDYGISFETHNEYFKQFGDDFKKSLIEQIDESVRKPSELQNLNENDRKLILEIQHHAYFCNENVARFQGREDLQDIVCIFNLKINLFLSLIKFKDLSIYS